MDISLENLIHGATAYLNTKGVLDAEVGIILGSGLNEFAEQIEDPIIVSYKEIPGFKQPKVIGHTGKVIYGTIGGKKVVALAGRFHFYEGFMMQEVTLPTRVLIKLGVKRIIITNAAGLINTDWNECELMLISDHINLSGGNPLIGDNLDEFGPRFPDMTDAYNKKIRTAIKKACLEKGITVREGVYTMMTGPSFETPAEIRFLRIIGADAVGMSSVPEAIVASQAGVEVVGISFLSNLAAGITGKAISGNDILENRKKVEQDFATVVKIAVEVE